MELAIRTLGSQADWASADSFVFDDSATLRLAPTPTPTLAPTLAPALAPALALPGIDPFELTAKPVVSGAEQASDPARAPALASPGGNFAPVLPQAADTVPGNTSSVVPLNLGSSVNVSIDTVGDHDWYRVTLSAGTTYTFNTQTDGTFADSYLNIRDASGNILAFDDDSAEGTYSLVGFTAPSSGTYFIDAGTYNDETTATYHLSMAAVVAAGDSVGGTTGTAGSLALTGSVDGNIDTAGDHDFYAITLTAGQTYLFRTGGTLDTDTTDTILTLRDAGGSQIVTNDDAGEGAFSAIRYTATATGTYYLDVSAYSSTTGAFNLTAFTTPPVTVFTYDQIASQLTNGYWGGSSHHFNVAPGGTITFNVQGLTAPGQFLARAALDIWHDVTGINFSEVTAGGQIEYDDNQTGAFANAFYSGGITTSAQVNVGTGWLSSYGTTLNSYSFQTYLHETGHALGLGHAGNYNGSADYSVDSLYLNDAWATTVMSYFSQTENTYFSAQGFTQEFVVSPMVADGIAVANLYGTNTLTRTGDTTYGFNNTSGRAIYDSATNPTVSYTIYDNGGTDTLDYSGFSQTQLINLNAETFSNVGGKVGNVSIARGAVIENAIGGSGADTITGNDANNTLNGGAGINVLSGGIGNDRLIVGTGASGTSVDGGAGTDTLAITGAVTSLGALAGIEAVELSGGGALTLTGTQFATGLSVTSTLSGTGTITVNMTAGVDFFTTVMTPAGGSAVSFIVNGTSGSDQIKDGQFAATINAGDGVDVIRTGNLVDTINGGIGDDKISGRGGADILTGGAGADTFRYVLDSDSGLGANADHITDFTIGTDKLAFRALDPNPGTPAIETFAFIGSQAFHATGSAEIHYVTAGADLRVEADLTGDGIADMHIILNGLAGQTLTGVDFLI